MRQTAHPFVFKGTVNRRGTAPATYTTTVDAILEATPALSDLVGQTVDVEVEKGTRLRPGDQRVFHTVPVSYGERILVRSIAAGRSIATDMASRVAGSDMVVRGQVEAVRDLREPKVTSVTEHAPSWREAVVKVQHVLKGNDRGGRIRVLFPIGTDVLWYEAPSIEVGQRWVFLLQKLSNAVDSAALTTGQKRDAVFTALHSDSVQPTSREAEIQQLVAPTQS